MPTALPPPTTRAARMTLAFSPVARSDAVVATVNDPVSVVAGFFKPPATSVTTSWLAGSQGAAVRAWLAVDKEEEVDELVMPVVDVLRSDSPVLVLPLHALNANAAMATKAANLMSSPLSSRAVAQSNLKAVQTARRRSEIGHSTIRRVTSCASHISAPAHARVPLEHARHPSLRVWRR